EDQFTPDENACDVSLSVLLIADLLEPLREPLADFGIFGVHILRLGRIALGLVELTRRTALDFGIEIAGLRKAARAAVGGDQLPCPLTDREDATEREVHGVLADRAGRLFRQQSRQEADAVGTGPCSQVRADDVRA